MSQRSAETKELISGLIGAGKRIDDDSCYRLHDLDLLTLGRLADQVRREKIGSENVGFIIDRNITFTNVCVSECNFCAFYKKPGSAGSYSLSIREVLDKVAELVELGGTQVMLQGGLNPKNDLKFYKHLLSSIKDEFPDIYLHSLSPAEIHYLAQLEDLSYKQILQALQSAGLDSLPGAAEILVDEIRRKVSPNKLDSQDWMEVMRAAHSLGMESTATMTFGLGESRADRIAHMLKLRKTQDETAGFRAFICWTFSPDNTAMPDMKMIGGDEYLKMVAISRLVLDNFTNIHSGWVTEGKKLAQTALFFGANDMGGVLMEEVVVKATGIKNTVNMDDMVRLISGAGKIPAQRNSKYEVLKTFASP